MTSMLRPFASRWIPRSRLFSTQSMPQTESRSSRPLRTVSLALSFAGFGYVLGSLSPPSAVTMLFPRPAPPPLDPDSVEGLQHTAELEQKLQTLPLLLSLRARPDKDLWYETRPYIGYPEERRANHLTAGTLRGPSKIAIPPVAIVRMDQTEALFIVHLGRALCGHDGIVHGGLLATILDETLARVAIANLPDRIGVTASLNIKYRAPTKADQFIVIKTQFTEVQGRKSFAQGRVEDLEGNLLVEADAMFVQPRYAKLLKNNAVVKAMSQTEAPATPKVVAVT